MAKITGHGVKSRDYDSARILRGAEFKQDLEFAVYSAIACERNKDQIMPVIFANFFNSFECAGDRQWYRAACDIFCKKNATFNLAY